MGEHPDAPRIGGGRMADVFDLGDGTVLRRLRVERDADALEWEVAVLRAAVDGGAPAPRVHRWGGRDLVMERIPGPTLGEAAFAGRISPDDTGRVLADLLRAVHAAPVPRDGIIGAAAAEWTEAHGDVPVLVHRDVHPMNVLVPPGLPPVLIDWEGAGIGDAGYDVALALLILGEVAVAGIDGVMSPAAAAAVCDPMARSLARFADADPLPALEAAAARRLEDGDEGIEARRPLLAEATDRIRSVLPR